ncbi:MAG: hypothetical protein ACRDEA_15605 [Microcystaceae cyanobacterium]
MRKDILEQRLKELEWTKYRLAKEIAVLRAAEGEEIAPAVRYQSTVNKALSDPTHVKVVTLEDLVKALGGEIIIRWHRTEQIVTGYDDIKID